MRTGKRRLGYAAVAGVCFLLIWGLSRSLFDIGQPYYMYTPSWTLRNVWWLAVLVSVVSALRGRVRLSLMTLGGYVLGVVAGEIFGGVWSHIPPEYPHYGWLIWGAVYAASALLGWKEPV